GFLRDRLPGAGGDRRVRRDRVPATLAAIAGRQTGEPGPGRVHAPQRAALGVVAVEVAGVDLDQADGAGGGEGEQDPVVAGSALAAGLPAVAHVRGAAGGDQVVHRREEHVAAGERAAAMAQRGEVELARLEPGPGVVV